MTDKTHSVQCPECGNWGGPYVQQSPYVIAEYDLKITSIHCTKCEYEGPPEGDDD